MGLEVKTDCVCRKASSIVLLCSTHFAVLAACFLLVTSLAYSSTVKTEGVLPAETSVDFYWATQLYNQEDNTLHSHVMDPQLQHKINLYLLC
jgi:hypothetical protein